MGRPVRYPCSESGNNRMKWIALPLLGVYLVEIEPAIDERGFFARTWCSEEMKSKGLVSELAQCSLCYNARRGTVRGMHYQAQPYAETKLVRCQAGAVYDVVLDLRPSSATYCRWFAAELNAVNHKALYIPEGCAHGFQCLADHSQVFYQISQSYRPECARGVRWDDALFGIDWPMKEAILSERDRSFPDFRP